MRTLVLDSTALNHFALADQLALLGSVVAGDRCVVPRAVLDELAVGAAERPQLADVLAVSWLDVVDVAEPSELELFARFKTELGGGALRNNGEAAVLAWSSLHSGTAIIDERAGKRIAQREGIVVHGSLWLAVRGFRAGILDRSSLEALVDKLRDTGMRLPTNGSGVVRWAAEQGLLMPQ